MISWNKKQSKALKNNLQNEMGILNAWCMKNGFDFKKVAEDYQRRLMSFEKEA